MHKRSKSGPRTGQRPGAADRSAELDALDLAMLALYCLTILAAVLMFASR